MNGPARIGLLVTDVFQQLTLDLLIRTYEIRAWKSAFSEASVDSLA